MQLNCDGVFCYQAKQIQIDDLLHKLDASAGELERLREEKDQEILIMQEGMDNIIQKLSEVQQVCDLLSARKVTC